MLITKRVLGLHRFASLDETRKALDGVHILKDGSGVATNGHVLAKVTPGSASPAVEDFPETQGTHEDPSGWTEGEGITIPSETCQEAEKAIPKGRKCRLPILNNAALTRDFESNYKSLEISDIDTSKRLTFREEESRFPNWKQVIPGSTDCKGTDSNGKTFEQFKADARAGKNGYKEYGISAEYLKQIADFRLADKESLDKMIHFFISDDPKVSIGFAWKDSDGHEVDGILMPMRV